MAWLMGVIQRRHRSEDENIYGESLNRPFDGVEIGLFHSMADARAALITAEKRGWQVGVHHHLVPPRFPFEMPRLTSADREVRREAFHEAEQAALEARAIGAHYVLFHLPFPALTRPGLNLSLWKHVGFGTCTSANAESPPVYWRCGSQLIHP